MKRIVSTFALALAMTSMAGAQPSMYYQWKNTSTGATQCEPESPGKGWEQVGGPFSDANCEILMPQ